MGEEPKFVRLLVEEDIGPAPSGGRLCGVRPASAEDIAAHVAALPHDDAVALLRGMLRARPEAAVEAVDTAKVARAWTNTGERWPLDRGVSAAAEVYTNGYSAGWVVYRPTLDEYQEHAGEGAAKDAADADLRRNGWVLVGGAR